VTGPVVIDTFPPIVLFDRGALLALHSACHRGRLEGVDLEYQRARALAHHLASSFAAPTSRSRTCCGMRALAERRFRFGERRA
jgi:hypothetical protein